tara:strand:- start:3078 stop:3263 length:186 start_codon:yes stop_codon:yes gene_type:complete
MKVGDLVIAKEDQRRGIFCIGLILEEDPGFESEHYYVIWSSDKPVMPRGWWKRNKLKVISN